MKKITLILLAMLLAMPSLMAQVQAPADRDMRQWLNDVREYKHDFLCKRLDIPRDRREKFFEVYDAMDDEIARLNSETRALERKIYDAPDGTVTDTEYEAATSALLELKAKEYEVEKNGYEQLANVLTKKQLFMLKRAERDFTSQIVRHHHKMKKDKKQ